MEAITLVLILLGCSISGIAQDNTQKKYFKNFDVMKDWNKVDTNYFSISPTFKPWSLENLNELKTTKRNFTYENSSESYFNMPIAKPGGSFNMPIAVPDSSVNFAIKEKRFNYINPLERGINSEFIIVKEKK